MSKLSCHCSFCDKSNSEVAHMIAGPIAFICDECVEQCVEIIQESELRRLKGKQHVEFLSAAYILKESGATRKDAAKLLKQEAHDVLIEVFGDTLAPTNGKVSAPSIFEHNGAKEILAAGGVAPEAIQRVLHEPKKPVQRRKLNRSQELTAQQ